MASAKRRKKYRKGAINEAPLVTEYDIIKKIWADTPMPTWVIDLILIRFFKEIRNNMKQGNHIFIKHFGALVPYERVKGIQGTKYYDPTQVFTMYKVKICTELHDKVRDATIRGKDVQDS